MSVNKINKRTQKESAMKTGAAYIRVSTEDQIEYSPDSQLKKIQEYAHSHQILLPKHLIFQDEGISGRSARKRPAFMKMIGMAKQTPRPFDVILVWKFSRFARSRQDSILYKSMLRKDCGINVISITEQLSDDPTAILIEALLEAMDEYYSINLAQEVRRGMYEKFSRGGVVSVPPFGYRMGAEHFEPDPEKAPLVPMMFQNFLNGMSCHRIAAMLNDLGVQTIRGNPFESRSVKYILTNPTYLGKLRRSKDTSAAPGHFLHTSIPFQTDKPAPAFPDAHQSRQPMLLVDGHHPPLVDSETFHLAQQRMALLDKKHTADTKTASYSYMLQGLVRCGNCGSILTPAEKGRSLQCCRYAKGLCHQSHHIRLEKLNLAVLEGLKNDLNDLVPTEKIHIRRKRTAVPEAETAAFTRLLEKEIRRLERIKTAYESGADSLEEYQTNKTASIRRIRKLKEKLGRQNNPLSPAAPDISLSPKQTLSLLARNTTSESAKNELLKAFISHITFFRPEDAICIHYRI